MPEAVHYIGGFIQSLGKRTMRIYEVSERPETCSWYRYRAETHQLLAAVIRLFTQKSQLFVYIGFRINDLTANLRSGLKFCYRVAIWL